MIIDPPISLSGPEATVAYSCNALWEQGPPLLRCIDYMPVNYAVLVIGLYPNVFHLSGLITVGTFSTQLALGGLTKLDKLLAVGTHPALFTVVGLATIVLSRHRPPSAQRTESRRAAQLTFHEVHPPHSRLQFDELAREKAPALPDRRRLWSAVGRTGPCR